MEGLTTIVGLEPGPTVVICAITHGDEMAGLKAHEFLLEHFKTHELKKGTLHLLKGNLEASKINQRYVTHDLNRMFKDNYGEEIDRDSYEYHRAQELKPFFANADYVLDIHSTSSPSVPFSIFPYSKETYDTYRLHLPVHYSTDGWDTLLTGTILHWVEEKGGESVAIECGQHEQPEAGIIAIEASQSFLQGLGLAEFEGFTPQPPMAHLHMLECVPVSHHETYCYTRTFESFGALEPGELIARDELREYRAPEEADLILVMPGSEQSIQKKLNHDAYFLAKKILLHA